MYAAKLGHYNGDNKSNSLTWRHILEDGSFIELGVRCCDSSRMPPLLLLQAHDGDSNLHKNVIKRTSEVSYKKARVCMALFLTA